MTPLILTMCFMFVCTLLLLGVIYSKFHWILKSLLVVSSLGFSVMCYNGYKNVLGYPVALKPPEVFQFLFGIVNEPYPAKNMAGNIYLWILAPDSPEPRALELPYSKQTRDVIQEAKERVKKGEQVFLGTKSEGQGDGSGDKQGKGSGKGQGNSQGSAGSNTVPYKLNDEILDFVQPENTLPRKAN